MRNSEAFQVCSENRHAQRILFETNIQEFLHLVVGLHDIPSRSSNTWILGTLLNVHCTMLSHFPKLTMNVSRDGTEHHESLMGGYPHMELGF
jgi:hypothetical protein